MTAEMQTLKAQMDAADANWWNDYWELYTVAEVKAQATERTEQLMAAVKAGQIPAWEITRGERKRVAVVATWK